MAVKFKSGTLSLTGATIIIIDKNKSPYGWKEDFKLQVKNDGNWSDLEIKNETITNDTVSYPNETGRFEQNISWLSTYGTLNAGNYRLVKKTVTGEEFFAEFVINDRSSVSRQDAPLRRK